MYHFLEEEKGKDWLDEWASITGDFDQIKAYTDLGDVFLVNSQTNEIGLLMTMANNFHEMGFTDWNEFQEVVMSNPNFQEDVVQKSFIYKVKEHCGELGDYEVYIPTPYPCLGGSGEPETHKKGDLWVYLAISSQTFAKI
ncbi:hypothetical protein GCM10008107_09420 [Psychrosphaera saromensis]|uniref:T6SS immunity protein Tdi1 C-terminal domain-containing protein n=1 Tax=Psychrosphaera saromensis TaxID=716813 RepID=A0A2S7UUV0_9GAMM|nr:T6SS immunity protein Tdi1 domain-containing protein [Psychrosphaera saromensis]PQJ53766.1 hypothetical protein BTO11_08895 [Psychrosphaera saromensis]GHB62458.1 hypothetical protein GCM10008107_09420 [Psychrosphaera saromensis]GLQ15445.1 hypothetical protein GCM10007917_29000 [Psychrosphaera saromensis]